MINCVITAVRRHTDRTNILKTSVEYTCVPWSTCWHMAHVHIAIFMVAPSVSSSNSGMSTRVGESFADDPQGSARSNNRAELRLTRRGKAEALMRFIVPSRSHLRGLWGTMCEKIQISELPIQVKKKVTEPRLDRGKTELECAGRLVASGRHDVGRSHCLHDDRTHRKFRRKFESNLAPGVKFDLESTGQPAQDFPRRSVEHRDVEQVAGWLWAAFWLCENMLNTKEWPSTGAFETQVLTKPFHR